MNRGKITDELTAATHDTVAAESIARKDYLTDREFLDALRPIVRHAHHRIIEVYKEIAAGYAEVDEVATPIRITEPCFQPSASDAVGK